jgi:hypothetical protein
MRGRQTGRVRAGGPACHVGSTSVSPLSFAWNVASIEKIAPGMLQISEREWIGKYAAIARVI